MLSLSLLLIACPQTIWYVDANAAGPGSGNALDPFPRIDYAVSRPSTLSGDTIEVFPGTYPDEAIDFDGKDLILRSSAGPAATILEPVGGPSGSSPIITLANGETLASRIQGFTLIAGGGRINASGVREGGAIYCDASSVTLHDLILRSPRALTFAEPRFGIGVYIADGELDVTDSTFEELGPIQSFSLNYGGGIYASGATVSVRGSNFERNDATRGAAIQSLSSSVTLDDCLFRFNSSFFGEGGCLYLASTNLAANDCEFTSNNASFEGGAIYGGGPSVVLARCSFTGHSASSGDPYSGGAIFSTGLLEATDCTFTSNRGQFGGAIRGTVDLDRCSFIDNRAFGNQFNCGGGALSGSGTVNECIFIGNVASNGDVAGAGALWGDYAVTRSTFIDNDASDSFFPVPSTFSGSGTLENCIVRGGSPLRISDAVTATFANIEGGFKGTGIIDQPESFWPDFGLLPDSPSIDVGNPAAPLDADGSRRDLGAFPFDPFRCTDECSPVVGTTTCTANVNSTGASATLSVLGSNVVPEDLLVLNVQDSTPGAFGYFLTARTGGNIPLGGGSQGLLCLSGNVLRFSNDILTDRGTDTVSFRAQLTTFPQGTTVITGDTWHFQYWFRDANPQPTSNTSSAVQIVFQ